MSAHDTDTLQISFDDQKRIFLHRKDPENKEITLVTFELQRFEAYVLIGAMLGIEEYQEEALNFLQKNNIIISNPNEP